jgi:hypothetical protein
MLTDYKISRITEYNGGSVTVVVKFHEGDITTEDEPDKWDHSKMVPVTRYRRPPGSVLRTETYHFAAGSREARYEAALTQFLNRELAKDPDRQPIPEQRNAS